jgi:chitin disaccharide deacetylase
MVGAPAAADAVARARRLPRLHVGLHLVLVDGYPALAKSEIPDLVTNNGEFDRNMARAAMRFFCLPRIRRELAMEIRAQFEAFCATGLQLDHVNAHKHMHLHPTVARLIVEIGRDYGMKAVRVPSEPVSVLRQAFSHERYPVPLHHLWAKNLRRRLKRAGLFVNDNIFGLAGSGGMVEERWLRLLPYLPEGVSEIYLHPATHRTPALVAAMPGYRQQEELAALLSPSVKNQLARLGIALANYNDLATAPGKM